jgi:cyclic pyranopterin phosphate synthase
MAPNVDLYNREVTYLRVSVTDRCNLRCTYCMPAHDFTLLHHTHILRYEEIIRVIQAAIEVGIKKVRFTGGEPLVRNDFVTLLQAVSRLPGLDDMAITTNGVFLKRWARPIFETGIHRINISLDTMNPSKFLRITGKDAFHQVWEGIEEAEAVGFSPIKLNVVVIKGMNDDELGELARLSMEKPYCIRFIEYMPVGKDNRWTPEKYMSSKTIKGILAPLGPLFEIPRTHLDGPAERYHFEGAKGEIGLISPLSLHFCPSCNRLRLTADGKLRPCLFSDDEVDLKTPLRQGCDLEDIKSLIREAIAAKPKRHHAADPGGQGLSRPMAAIGG